jgi:hypothetical protein
LIAQDVQKVDPGAVAPMTPAGHLGVNYAKVLMAMGGRAA